MPVYAYRSGTQQGRSASRASGCHHTISAAVVWNFAIPLPQHAVLSRLQVAFYRGADCCVLVFDINRSVSHRPAPFRFVSYLTLLCNSTPTTCRHTDDTLFGGRAGLFSTCKAMSTDRTRQTILKAIEQPHFAETTWNQFGFMEILSVRDTFIFS